MKNTIKIIILSLFLILNFHAFSQDNQWSLWKQISNYPGIEFRTKCRKTTIDNEPYAHAIEFKNRYETWVYFNYHFSPCLNCPSEESGGKKLAAGASEVATSEWFTKKKPCGASIWISISDVEFGDRSKVFNNESKNVKNVDKNYTESLIVEQSANDKQENKNIQSEIDNTFTDTRDGKVYKKVRIGKQVWMSQNLNYNTSDSWCYNNSESNCNQYGRLYTWQAAQRACPTGWHLPSKFDIETLLKNVGGVTTAAYNSLKQGGSSGFSAPFGGFRFDNGTFDGIGEHIYFWCSSSDDMDFGWSMTSGSLISKASVKWRSFGLSVRCLQDN